MNTKILKGYDNYVLFGVLRMGEYALKQLREAGIDVARYCDNDKSKWGTVVNGVSVIEPAALPEYVRQNNALVIISSSWAKHFIAMQIEEMGLPYIYFSKPYFVELTSFCNQACIFCPYEYIKRPKSNLNPEIMKEFLRDLASENSNVMYPTIYPHVLGEPLVSKHFFDFMDTCKELGFYVCVVTNWALMNQDIQHRIFTQYPEMDMIFSLQGASEKVFDWRKEKKLTYKQWIDLMFEIMESKFKYGQRGYMEICLLYPNLVNDLDIRSDSEPHIFKWYDSAEEFKQWKRDFGARCVEFDREMRRKYPENYEAIKSAKSPISYYYGLHNVIEDFEQWVECDRPSQFMFAPNIHTYEKRFGTWYVEDLMKSLLPDGKYLHWEENWHAMTEKCDRVGDVSLLSSGQIVVCNIDNEAEYVIADMNKGEKLSDVKAQERIRQVRSNLSLSTLCRRCKARALVFDTAKIEGASQELVHYGIRWHKKRENKQGEIYRVSYELSSVFAYPRIKAASLEVDIASVQDKKQFTLIKILSYDDETKLFTERRNYSIQLKPGERMPLSVPYEFEESKLHRIDFITATQRVSGVDDGVAVYSIRLAK